MDKYEKHQRNILEIARQQQYSASAGGVNPSASMIFEAIPDSY